LVRPVGAVLEATSFFPNRAEIGPRPDPAPTKWEKSLLKEVADATPKCDT